jgi:hypothetical protein
MLNQINNRRTAALHTLCSTIVMTIGDINLVTIMLIIFLTGLVHWSDSNSNQFNERFNKLDTLRTSLLSIYNRRIDNIMNKALNNI